MNPRGAAITVEVPKPIAGDFATMNTGDFFRGGNSLAPRPIDVRIDPSTGLLRPGRGVSVYSRPDGLERFGGAHRITQLPPELTIIQVGRDPAHHEIVPVGPMTLEEYEQALQKITLVPV